MFALHVSPATEINFITLDNPKKELKEGKNIRKNISKFLSFPYQKIRKIIKLPILYRESYHLPIRLSYYLLISKAVSRILSFKR